MNEILRKYIRYVLNEKPFNPELIVNLIHLRKETQLDDSQVAGILNEISERIVRDKGKLLCELVATCPLIKNLLFLSQCIMYAAIVLQLT